MIIPGAPARTPFDHPSTPTHARTFACTHTHPECLGRAQITHRRTLRDSVVRFPWGGAGAALRPGAHWRCDAHRLKRTLTRVTRVARSQVVCASLASVSPSLEQYFLRARCERFANPCANSCVQLLSNKPNDTSCPFECVRTAGGTHRTLIVPARSIRGKTGFEDA